MKEKKKKAREWLGLDWFYGISTIVGYLIPNPFYTYILNIWFLNTFCKWYFLTDLSLSVFGLQLNGFTYFYLIRIILLTISHLFERSLMFASLAI